jgi:hypothetical protein
MAYRLLLPYAFVCPESEQFSSHPTFPRAAVPEGKRVLRIMQANKLTLERHTGRRPGRTHDGVAIAFIPHRKRRRNC